MFYKVDNYIQSTPVISKSKYPFYVRYKRYKRLFVIQVCYNRVQCNESSLYVCKYG